MAEKLLGQITEATGLPENWVKDEFTKLLIAHGFDPETITLEQVRLVLADYLQDVMAEAKDSI